MKLGSMLIFILFGLSTISAPNSASPVHTTSFIVQANTLSHSTKLTGPLAFSLDGKWLTCGSGERNVVIWDVKRRTIKHILHPQTFTHLSATFSPDSKILATGGWDADVRLWEVKTGKLVKALSGAKYGNRIHRIVFTPDGQTLLAATYHGFLESWNLATGKRTKTADADRFRAWDLCIASNGQAVAMATEHGTGDWDEAVDICNVSTCKRLKSLVVKRPSSGVSDQLQSVSYSPTSSLIATGSQQALRLWNVRTGKLHRTLEAHTDAENGFDWVSFRPDGKTLLSANANGNVRIWSLQTGTILKTFNWHGKRDSYDGFALSPDGTTLACAFRGLIYLHNISK